MVACGATDDELEVGGAFLEDLFWGGEGVKADERTEAMAEGDQDFVMLSGKSGESRMRTSFWGERRPRREAEARSSRWRVGPRLSALPGSGRDAGLA